MLAEISKREVGTRLALAGLSLIFGGSIYLFVRTPLYPSIAVLQEFIGLDYLNSFQVIFGSVPTLSHTFSFAILTSLFLPQSRASYALNSFSWICLESVFELWQNPLYRSYPLVDMIGSVMLCHDNCRGYFLLGTYDELDLGSIIVGGGLAWAYLIYSRRRDNE